MQTDLGLDERPIDSLPLPPRARTVLRAAHIETISQLRALTLPDLMEFKHMGRVTAAQVAHVLGRAGIPLRDGLPVPEEEPSRWLNAPLDLLGLPEIVLDALRLLEVEVVGEICRLRPAELPARLRARIEAALTPLGLTLQGTMAVDPSLLPLLDPVPAAWVTESVAVLDLSNRSGYALQYAGITTLGQLCEQTPRKLLAIRRFGRTCLAEVRRACYRKLFAERPVDDPWAGELVAVPHVQTAAAPVTLADWLALLLEGQRPQAREVLVLRWGLNTGQPLTLEQVGRRLGLTRQRIGDVEKTAIQRLAGVAPHRLDRFSGQVAELVRAAGGVVRVADVTGPMTQLYPAEGVDPAAFARFAFPYCRHLEDWQDDRWAVVEADRAAQQVVATMVGLLAREGVPLQVPELVARTCAEHPGVDPQWVAACLQAGPLRIVMGNWVFLRKWMKTHKARFILAALRSIGRPAHFTEVGARLRELVPALAQMTDLNIHATLGRLPEVRLTSRGVFALANWGVAGVTTIVDLLAAALQEIGGPAPPEELVAYVLARKVCRERSIRSFLSTDPRFQRLSRDRYALAGWGAGGGAAAHLADLRTVPAQPDSIMGVLDRLVARGRMDSASLGPLLAEFRQAWRRDDYLSYLLRRGWAVLEEDGWLVPADRARELCAIADPAERLLRFAMSDANFQAYLLLRCSEHLVWLSGREQGDRLVANRLGGRMAPLRPFHAVATARLERLGYQAASAKELESLLALTLRAPGVPQVYSRWVEPVTGWNPGRPSRLCKWVANRLGSFPAWPSTVLLSWITRPAARLLCLAAGLAAAADVAVDYTRLRIACAGRLGGDCPDLSLLAAELLAWGVFLDDRDPAQVRLLSPHELFVRPADVPGGLPSGLDGLATSLRADGVLVRHRDSSHTPPVVRLHVTG